MRGSLLIFTAALAPAFADCIALTGEDIHARDLARAVPAFSAADPDAVLGRTPAAGVRRVFTARDLMAAARVAGIASPMPPPDGVCFERAVYVLRAVDLDAAMAAAFPGMSVQIAIADFSRYPVPKGHVEFPLSGLGMPPPAHPETPVMWRGKISLEGGRTTEIWARVRIVARRSAWVAVKDIRAGSQINPDQIRMAQIEGFPLRFGPQIEDANDVAGRIARHSIAAGQEILPQMLDEPREVHAGDKVQVLVDCGNARVSLEAVALGDGRKGETIVVRNPVTHSAFRAIVQARDRVVVHADRRDRS